MRTVLNCGQNTNWWRLYDQKRRIIKKRYPLKFLQVIVPNEYRELREKYPDAFKPFDWNAYLLTVAKEMKELNEHPKLFYQYEQGIN